MKYPPLRLAVTSTALSLGFASPLAFAELGNAPSYSTPNSQVVKHRVVQPADALPGASTAADRYMIYQTTLHSGVVVREYASLAGTVFGIAWTGSAMPDLRTLLGPEYFQTYLNELKQRDQASRGLHNPVMIKTDTLVVESIGHQNAFFGRAYLPKALQQLNVSESAIQSPEPVNQPEIRSR